MMRARSRRAPRSGKCHQAGGWSRGPLFADALTASASRRLVAASRRPRQARHRRDAGRAAAAPADALAARASRRVGAASRSSLAKPVAETGTAPPRFLPRHPDGKRQQVDNRGGRAAAHPKPAAGTQVAQAPRPDARHRHRDLEAGCVMAGLGVHHALGGRSAQTPRTWMRIFICTQLFAALNWSGRELPGRWRAWS